MSLASGFAELEDDTYFTLNLSSSMKSALKGLLIKYESLSNYNKNFQKKLLIVLEQEEKLANIAKENSEILEEIPGLIK